MMFLKKKSIYILSLFLTLKKCSISELEIILKLKRRSILKNISIINRFLQTRNLQGIIKNGEHLYLNKEEILKIKNLEINISIDYNERKNYIVLELLLSNQIKLSNIFVELDITRRTLNYDIKKIKDYLKEYNLSLMSLPSKGIFLIGNEYDIRNLLSNYLTKFMIQKKNCHKLLTTLIDKNFSKKKLEEIEEIVLNLMKKRGIELPVEFFYKVLSIILVHFFREEKFCDTNLLYKTSQKLFENEEYKELLFFLKNNGLENLNIYELDLIAEIFLLFDKDKYINNIEIETKIFLKTLELVINKSIPKDNLFLMQISNILKIGKFKIEFNFYESKELYELNKDYEEYYIHVNKVIKNLIPEFYTEDIIALTLFIKNSLDNLNVCNNMYKKIIIVDNSFNSIYGKMCLNYLERNYFVDILKIVKSYELKEIVNSKADFYIVLNYSEKIDLELSFFKVDVRSILNNSYDLEQYGLLKK